MPKGWELAGSLMFSSWNQIIKDIRNIYKLKELIKVPVNTVSYI